MNTDSEFTNETKTRAETANLGDDDNINITVLAMERKLRASTRPPSPVS
jgi:hypothetical protein